MIRNLVENALHYTTSTPAAPGHVTVRLQSDPFSRALVLQVEDNGPGVPAAERETVFQPFYRALGTNVHGTGLGLSIVRRLCERHAIDLRFEQEEDGTVAYLPLRKGAGLSPASRTPSALRAGD